MCVCMYICLHSTHVCQRSHILRNQGRNFVGKKSICVGGLGSSSIRFCDMCPLPNLARGHTWDPLGRRNPSCSLLNPPPMTMGHIQKQTSLFLPYSQERLATSGLLSNPPFGAAWESKTGDWSELFEIDPGSEVLGFQVRFQGCKVSD